MIALLLSLAAAPASRDCFVEESAGAIKVMRYIGDRTCVDWKPARVYRGVYVDAFEGQSYYDGADSWAAIKGRNLGVWFSTDAATRYKVRPPKGRFPVHAYLVTFRGREAQDMHRAGMNGYGHLGVFPGVVLVDELLDVHDLGPAGD